MKTKIYLLILFISTFYLLFSNTHAQDLQLGNIDLSFCNNQENSNELDLTAKAGETKDICIKFSNSSTEDTTINVDFLDAALTQDEPGNKLRSCNAADRPKEHFGNFLSEYEKELTIPGNSSIKKTYKIKLPIGFKGLSHGCVAYNLVNKKEGESMLNIVVRKVKFIDIFVGETQVKSQIEIGSIKTIKDGKKTNFQIGLKNIGNTKQKISISGTISNPFGFKEILELTKNNFEINANDEITIQTNNENLILPIYKSLFTVYFQITNTPQFNFNIQENGNIPEEVVLGGNFLVSRIIFIFSPYFYGFIFILLVLIYLAIFKKRKKKIIILNNIGNKI